jgi:hypothetical protein
MPTLYRPDWRVELIRAVQETLADPDRTARLILVLLTICVLTVTLACGYQLITEGVPLLPRLMVTMVNH